MNKSNNTLEAHEFNLGEVFCDKYDFTIPGYQRPYSWETEQAVTLVDDLLIFIDEYDNIDDSPPYFLGSFVLIKPNNSTESEVVDGQQRITTLTILFSILRELSKDSSRKGYQASMNACIFREGETIKGTIDKPRLITRDQSFFSKYIQKEGNLQSLLDMQDVLTGAEFNIRENTKAMYKLLENFDQDKIHSICRLLMNNCFVVVVTTQDVDSAYRIFSVMNDRGLDLGPTDILKPIVIGAINTQNDQQNHYINKWERIESDIGRDNFVTLFSHLRMIRLRTKSRSNLVSDFKKYIKPQSDAIGFIDNQLEPYSRAYDEIIHETYESNGDTVKINKSIKWLNHIDNSDWLPVAIYYLNKYRGQDDKLTSFFTSLETLVSVMMVNREVTNKRIIRFSQILDKVDDNHEFNNDSPLYLTGEEKELAIQQLSGSIYKISRIRLMVLMRLNSELSDEMAVYNYKKITIEHVLPQTPEDGSKWLEWFPDEVEREELVHCLGNLALLSRHKNSAAKNYEFDKKKSAYFNPIEGQNSFVITQQILDEPDTWTPEKIKSRQRILLDKLIDVWELV